MKQYATHKNHLLWKSADFPSIGSLANPWPHFLTEIEGNSVGVALIPKVASTSCLVALTEKYQPLALPPFMGSRFLDTLNLTKLEKSVSITDRGRILKLDLTVAFVRDPADRLASVWRDKVCGQVYRSMHPLSLPYGFSFPDFVRWVGRQDPLSVDKHVRPQWSGVATACRLYPLTSKGVASFSNDFVVTMPKLNEASGPEVRLTRFMRDVIGDYYQDDRMRFDAACAAMRG
jgi:hypothetical protein